MIEAERKTPEQVAEEFKARQEAGKADDAEKSKRAEEGGKDVKKEEARDASKGSSPETEKTKGEAGKDNLSVEDETRAKEDERILNAEESELSDEDKSRKAVLLEVDKREKAKLAEKEDKDVPEGIRKRFAELTGQIKDLKSDKESNKAEISRLIKEKDELASKIEAISDSKVKSDQPDVKKVQETIIQKFLDEDKEKPREERREMSKEELDDWLIDDFGAAQEWIVERSLRRKDIATRIEFQQEQNVHVAEGERKHPELNVSARTAELEKEGKSKEEIFKILTEENPKYRTMFEVMKDHPEWFKLADGPKKFVEEMEKRLEKTKETPKAKADEEDVAEKERKRQEEINEAVEIELKRREMIDEGLSSSKQKGKSKGSAELTELESKQVDLGVKAGISREKMEARVISRRKIPGRSQ